MTHGAPRSLRTFAAIAATLFFAPLARAQLAGVDTESDSASLEAAAPPPPSVAGPSTPASAEPTVAPVETAEEPAAEAEDEKWWRLSIGADFTTAYFFRGILQEDDGLIAQHYATLELDVLTTDELTLTLDGGTWNSFHTEKTGSDEADDDFKRSWYEIDGFGGITLTRGPLSLRAAYYLFSSPSDAWPDSQEITLTLSFDDEECFGDWAVYPTATFAFEIDDEGADGGENRGSYLELGITPGVDLPFNPEQPWRLEFPFLLGLGIDDYYENDAGHSQTFGYFEGGARVLIPLPIPVGDWTLSAGVRVLYLGDAAREFNEDGDASEVIGTLGISAEF